MSVKTREDFTQRIEAIEKGYEYMLAYAAQGRDSDGEGGSASSAIRDHLQEMEKALEGLGGIAVSTIGHYSAELAEASRAFLDALEADAGKAQGAIRLVLAQPGISSQLIDNLNASIHVRALLTDLFVIDEALKKLL